MPTMTVPANGRKIKYNESVTLKQEVDVQSYKQGLRPANFDKIRRMRRHPTIALCRQLFLAGHWAAAWSYEPYNDEVPDEQVDYIKENLEPYRRRILSSGALGCFDFGWQPWEKIYEMEDGFLTLKHLKPLLQDITAIEEDPVTGEYLGFQQDWFIPREKAVLANYDQEGTMWEGYNIMENLHMPYDQYCAVSDTAIRFDKKMAGSHWVIQYPDGTATFNGQEDTPNSEIADSILTQLQSSGLIAIPRGKTDFQELQNEDSNAWSIELVTASGSSFPFDERFRYLDALMCRGAGFPERSVLEGQHGTKAEADVHADFTITIIEYRHATLLEHLNHQLVNQMLMYQFGNDAKDNVKITAAPLTRGDVAALRAIYDKILSNGDGMMAELDDIDTSAIRDQLEIPSRETEEIDDASDTDLLPTGLE